MLDVDLDAVEAGLQGVAAQAVAAAPDAAAAAVAAVVAVVMSIISAGGVVRQVIATAIVHACTAGEAVHAAIVAAIATSCAPGGFVRGVITEAIESACKNDDGIVRQLVAVISHNVVARAANRARAAEGFPLVKLKRDDGIEPGAFPKFDADITALDSAALTALLAAYGQAAPAGAGADDLRSQFREFIGAHAA